MSFNNILIIGLGLMGGSTALSIRKLAKNQQQEIKIFGNDPDKESTEYCLANKLIDKEIELIEGDISFLDLIIITAPLKEYKAIFQQISSSKFSQNLAIIDFGSLKDFIKNIIPNNLEKHFIPMHPIAGSEKSGPQHANSNFFDNRKIIITQGQDEILEKPFGSKIINFIENIGFKIDFLSADKHDYIYGALSHIPQLIASSSQDIFGSVNNKIKALKNHNSQAKILWQKSFRIDNSESLMWIQTFELNQENLEEFYQKFFNNLLDVMELIEQENFSKLQEEYQEAYKKAKIIYQAHRIDLDEDKTTINHEELNLSQENLNALNLRILIIIAYLNIEEILEFKDFAGMGLIDFILPIFIFKNSEDFWLKNTRENSEDVIYITNQFLDQYVE